MDMVQDMAGYGVNAAVGETGEVEEEAGLRGDCEGGRQRLTTEMATTRRKRPSRSSSKKLKGSRTAGLMRKLSSRKPSSSPNLEKLGKMGPKSKTIAMPDASQTSSTSTTPPGKGEPHSQSATNLQNGVSFADSEPGGQAVIFKPSDPLRIPNSDINISVERRNRAPASVEGEAEVAPGVAINEPGEDSPVPQMQAADWKGGNDEDPTADKHLGLRMEDPDSQGVSKASSVKSLEVEETGGSVATGEKDGDDQASIEGVKISGPTGEEVLDALDEAVSGNGQGSGCQPKVKGRDPAIL
ncbi:hypothetical protein CHGG_04409 [Chaetomium globosum CBS 148.51]|uniref:Uncharacterized protein n=1 Tax=Chaetomium globosum (strain ATCC 6205 / CBS 148.51 / DSM 1962 / NBRC 6347 / NRRL 1970) TaxID=306901 RepID=Q2H1D7_CHAGB|nr:uncharacterized protein CHGG_04409 [Chaetomium globosum CBS 148.51]EAQ87790.1 hypothetical protein CHGG_04409 [Chaetomium globosum CBS 148.51]